MGLTFVTGVLARVNFKVFVMVCGFCVERLNCSRDIGKRVVSVATLTATLVLIPTKVTDSQVKEGETVLFKTITANITVLFEDVIRVRRLLVLFTFFAKLAATFLRMSNVP